MITIIGTNGDFSDITKFMEKINNFSEKNNVTIQVFNADMIYGKEHLISAVNHAKRAMKENKNSTKTLSMEILLYASGERQLKHAIPKMGIKKGKGSIAFVFTNNLNDNSDKDSSDLINSFIEEFKLIIDDKVLEGSDDTLEKFGIKKNEIETVAKDKLGDLILEIVAMVDIIK